MYEGDTLVVIPCEGKIDIRCVVEKYEKDYIVANIIDDNMTQYINVGDILNCAIYNRFKGQIYFDADVKEVLGKQLHLVNIINMREVQRRSDVRVAYQVPITISKVVKPPETEVPLKEPLEMVTRDKSAGGILLYSDKDLEIGLELHFPLTLFGGINIIPVVATVVRKIILSEGFLYGCILKTSCNQDLQLLRRSIFDIQIDERKRAKLEQKKI